MIYLQFTETPRFMQQASKILGENGIQGLQSFLLENPEKGVVIQNSGGIRKLRWSASGRGKRGGSRVIYYLAVAHGRILLLDMYSKNEKSDLSKSEIAVLRSQRDLWMKKL